MDILEEDFKLCQTCETFKSIELFARVGNRLRKTCNDCLNQTIKTAKRRLRRNQYEKSYRGKLKRKEYKNSLNGKLLSLIQKANSRAKEKKLQFDIDFEWVKQQYENQKGRCKITNLPFDLTTKVFNRPNATSPSLDRIDTRLGYTKENTRLVINQYNIMRSDYGDQQALDVAFALVKENYKSKISRLISVVLFPILYVVNKFKK